MSDADLVSGLQKRAAMALPAVRVDEVGGWWLRYAPRCAWWVGTVLPLGAAGPDELVRRVVGAEEFYAGLGTVARFQISPPASPARLDVVLAQRGYLRESPMSLRTASTARVTEQVRAGPAPVRVDDRATRAWFDVWHAVHGYGDPRAEWDLLGRVERPCAYASAVVGDDVVAVGRAVADTGWAGVFGMATLPEARGKGAGRAVLAALARWAGAHGADRMYLQVEHANVPACQLYARAGFREVSAYHYRASSRPLGHSPSMSP